MARWKKSTARIWTDGNKGGRTSLPYAFTEQGVYMLMTVLKGDLAVRQSIALVKLFKSMKDALLINPTTAISIESLSKDFASHEERIGLLESKLDIVMDRFEDPSSRKEFLIMDGERVEAGLAYRGLYSRAKRNIILIDDYVGAKTLHLLKSCKAGVFITILSDNVAKPPLGQSDLNDFQTDTGLTITMKPTMDRVHDRYIAIDYGDEKEEIYLCGASSKDAGSKITTIIKAEDPLLYHPFIDALLA